METISQRRTEGVESSVQTGSFANRNRNYGIDLGRLVFMFMVCVMHTLKQGGILGSSQGRLNTILWFFEIFAFSAVDGFALISGYTANNTPRRYEKLVQMWFQAFFYSFIVTLVLTIAGFYPKWTLYDWVRCALPITGGTFWYVSAYFALFIVTPILNKFLFALDEKGARAALFAAVFLFSIMETVCGAFKMNSGYSAAWLIVLYCIGVLIRRGRVLDNVSSVVLICIWGGCILLPWLIHRYTGNKMLVNYVSPTVLASGLIMVILFSRLKIGHVKLIAMLSPLSLGIYLFQNSPAVWKHLDERFVFAVHEPIVVCVLYVFLIALAIFLSGLLIELIRSKLAKALQIPKFSMAIVHTTGRIIGRIAALGE